MKTQYRDFVELVGLTVESITGLGDDDVVILAGGRKFKMYHDQDCCEHVTIKTVTGDPLLLVGSRITAAEQTSPDLPDEGTNESFTWTEFVIRTANRKKLTILWFGSSNGYYSEGVSFTEVVA